MHNGRIVPRRTGGILKSLKKKATFWTGRTAQRIVAERLQQNTKEKEAKRIARAAARASRSNRTVEGPSAVPATLVPKELRRLERALKRRKTLEARQRIAARIAELKQELGL